MKIFVLYDKSGIHSGRTLGSRLIREFSGKALVQKGRPERLALLLKRGNKYDYIINVGWFRTFDTGGASVLNTPEAVSLSSNKRKARIRFKTKKIPAPQLWLTQDNIQKQDLPIIARTTHHAKGRGLWFCKSMDNILTARHKGASHFLKFIPHTREFRVHVMAPSVQLSGLSPSDYKVIKLSEKIPKQGAVTDEVVKNHESGWFFSYPKDRKEPVLTQIRDLGRKTLAEFGLHWGAVDIMLSLDTGELFVLEINSTPCLTDDQANTLEKYAQGIGTLTGAKPTKKSSKPKMENPPPKQQTAPIKPRNKRRLNSFLRRHNF